MPVNKKINTSIIRLYLSLSSFVIFLKRNSLFLYYRSGCFSFVREIKSGFKLVNVCCLKNEGWISAEACQRPVQAIRCHLTSLRRRQEKFLYMIDVDWCIVTALNGGCYNTTTVFCSFTKNRFIKMMPGKDTDW